MALSHTISSEDISCLKNNYIYVAQIQVYDVNGDSSSLSDPVLFTCHTNPVFKFDNVEDETTISSENITLH